MLTDLWIGVEEAKQRGEGYRGLFLGSLVVLDAAAAEGGALPGIPSGTFLIIDGKQRLTTLAILLVNLSRRLGDRAPWIGELLTYSEPGEQPDTRRDRLKLGVEEVAFLEAADRDEEPPETDGDLGEDQKSWTCIRECKLTIEDDCDARNDDDLMDLAVFIRDQLAIALISAPDMDTAYRVFVSTNHRGKPLSLPDILKAELIGEVPSADKAATLARWNKLAKSVGEGFDLLPGFLHALYGRRQRPQIVGLVTLSRDKGAPNFLEEIVFPAAESLPAILNAAYAGIPEAPAINRSLRMLCWLKARDWVPPVLAFNVRYPGEYDKLAVYLAALERLVFTLHVGTVGGDLRATRYRHVIDAVRAGQPFDGSAGPLALTRDDQQALLSRANGGIYKRSTTLCKYLLKRLSAESPDDVLVDTLSGVSVEHILPTNLSPKSPWFALMPDPQEREAANRSLGNLVLLSIEQNRRARNMDIEAKLRVYFPDGALTPHAITNELKGIDRWTFGEVKAREQRLMATLRKIAGIPDTLKAERPRRR